MKIGLKCHDDGDDFQDAISIIQIKQVDASNQIIIHCDQNSFPMNE